MVCSTDKIIWNCLSMLAGENVKQGKGILADGPKKDTYVEDDARELKQLTFTVHSPSQGSIPSHSSLNFKSSSSSP